MGVESLENRGRRFSGRRRGKNGSWKFVSEGWEVGEKKKKKKKGSTKEKKAKNKKTKKKENIHIKMFRCRRRAKLTRPRI